jgi:hypothetical protein
MQNLIVQEDKMKKPNSGKQLFTLLALLFFCTLFVMAGCSKGNKKAVVPGEEWAEDLQTRIEKHIADPEKKSQLLDLVDQDTKIFKELLQVTREYDQKLFTLDRNYDAAPDDFRNLFADYNEARYRLRDQSMAGRFNMKALCTAEEWKKLSHFRTKKGLFGQLRQAPGGE